jgi:hypothetical protein
MQDTKELLNIALDILDGKDRELDIKEFKSFCDLDLSSQISTITGSGKGNVSENDLSVSSQKAQECFDEIKKSFI